VLAVALLAGCGTGTGASGRLDATSRSDGSAYATTILPPPAAPLSEFADPATVKAAVSAGQSVTRLPSTALSNVEDLASEKLNIGYLGDGVVTRCPRLAESQARLTVANCTFGDRAATRTIVLLGDSRAQMWFETINAIATAQHWKLIVLTKSGCPAAVGSFRATTPAGVETNAPSTACDSWHQFLLATVRRIGPQVIIDSSSPNLLLEGGKGFATPARTVTAMEGFFRALPSGSEKVLLGGFPNPYPSPVLCLSKNPMSAEKCSYRPTALQLGLNAAAQRAAARSGVGYISESPWLCAATCPAVIDGLVPYTLDGFHIQSEFATYLTGVMWAGLEPYLDR
jgi:hypothetical protein